MPETTNKPSNMLSTTSRKTRRSTSRTTSPTSEPSGRLLDGSMSIEESDRILREAGFRPATPEEVREAREAVRRSGVDCQW